MRTGGTYKCSRKTYLCSRGRYVQTLLPVDSGDEDTTGTRERRQLRKNGNGEDEANDGKQGMM
jgi:hypothetical protein